MASLRKGTFLIGRPIVFCCLSVVSGEDRQERTGERRRGGDSRSRGFHRQSTAREYPQFASTCRSSTHHPLARGGSREKLKWNSPNCCPILKSGSSHGCLVSLVSDLHRWRSNVGAQRLSLLLGDDELNWAFVHEER